MFSFFTQKLDDHEKRLRASTIMNDSNTLNIHDLKLIVQGFPQLNVPSTPSNLRKNFQKFFGCIPSKCNYKVKLKILATCHVLLDDFMCGNVFSQSFLQWEGFKNKENNAQIALFIKIYFELLQRLANAYSILKISKQQKLQPINQFLEQQQSYYQSFNLLNLIFSYTDTIKKILEQKPDEIICEITLLLWNDVIAIYLYIEKLIFCFIGDYQTIPHNLFYQILDFVPDFQILTIKIKQFYKLNDFCQEEKQFLEPQWKVIDEKLLDELTTHKQRLKIQTARNRMQIKSKVSFSTQLLTPQHGSSTQSYFSNTTFGYMKRLSTVEDPFTEQQEDMASKRFKTLMDNKKMNY